MNKKVAAITFLLLLATAVTLAAGAGCGGAGKTAATTTTEAAQQSPQPPKASVATVANDPQAYDGKSITTEGNYAVGYCSACFLLKDGVSALRVEVSETVTLPPESKLGSRMKVSGRIYVVKGSPNLVASKLEYE
jgi:uncharacterized protein YdeI (BOF family)